MIIVIVLSLDFLSNSSSIVTHQYLHFIRNIFEECKRVLDLYNRPVKDLYKD